MAERLLTFSIFRYNPNTPEIKPYMQEYKLEEMPGMTLFVALNKIREEQDPSLMFDFVCRAAICGSCAMLVNGKPRLACKTLTKDLPSRITLLPLPVFKLVGDLSVDTGTWFRHMSLKTEAWIHTTKEFDPQAREERMDNETALKIYEAERCIECGCCIAGCATANIREDFIGAAGINRVARFMVDPRDERSPQEYFEVVGTEEGTFGCVGLMACEDNCPMGLPLQMQLAYVRRRMAAAGLAARPQTRAC
ncbi:fumarate reductase iron-sulfur subunit [Desulfofundulus sp. TPOSR]|uniref:Fumarate reductase iron-sulfur subunit n=1 Tax=Desulfofundulus kuznetsovii (strain DSM 6115 / VKM B-1805 / 17) TaxID=760568 RepID=A0AAU8P8D1_DESK7|nr:fumarate reductase iron-sulfur subunit [Desulfofundulus sp. TPOSR]AEG14058.1 succinate dehydrogenase and fumarate reductase iron-sulfur protein [Desulfofundulus kuznetsovii DSM 6115]NHM26279.1 fumarate reductase iron-sulfur subunit [Desulfofundulus sp. TPOSR]